MSSTQGIFNKMTIFRKWKFQSSKHKKLIEEWALANSVKDLSDENDEDCNNEQDENSTKFNVKYLGKTLIDAERSQNATSEAIKSVITNSSKTITTIGNNNEKTKIKNKPQRVHLIVCPKGIEMRDANTNEILLRVSIYKISYCSADAAHDRVFAFVGSPHDIKNTGTEQLSCYVYLCPKRRIAHDVTLTVAKCFENAYQNWRDSIEQKMITSSLQNNKELSSAASSIDASGASLDSSVMSSSSLSSSSSSSSSQDNSTMDNLLIDLSQENATKSPSLAAKICNTDHRNYLQNTWVSFEDEQIDMEPKSYFTSNSTSAWDSQLVF